VKEKKQTNDKAAPKRTIKERNLKDLPCKEDRDVKGGAIDSYIYFTPSPPPPPPEPRK
jgi:hypothetical protein